VPAPRKREGSSEIMTDMKSRQMMEAVAKSCDALAQSAEREEASSDQYSLAIRS
jgi:hypothetical protein